MNRKQRIFALLKGIETGDPASVQVVHPDTYIQHNPMTREGGEGLAALFKRLSKSEPRVNIVRLFQDGDYVFGHTEYDFTSSKIGFEVFRFEGDHTVEHWDNIQKRKGPNPSGHSMVDGPTESEDHEHTESHRRLVRTFVDQVLIHRKWEHLDRFVHENLIQHDPHLSDGLVSLRAALTNPRATNGVKYKTLHRVFAEGNFVLTACEGSYGDAHSAFYDLYRIADRKMVEHWNTVEAIPPRHTWKNQNGKFMYPRGEP